MGDLSDKGSECDYMTMSCKNRPDRDGSITSDGGCCFIRTCADCGTTKTPLWRGGPAGPKSLCNACGIRSRKKRRALLVIRKDDKKPKKSTSSLSNGGSQSSGLTTSNFCLKKRLMSLESEVVVQRPRSKVTKQRRKLGEEEQAALLLMALSCASVFG